MKPAPTCFEKKWMKTRLAKKNNLEFPGLKTYISWGGGKEGCKMVQAFISNISVKPLPLSPGSSWLPVALAIAASNRWEGRLGDWEVPDLFYTNFFPKNRKHCFGCYVIFWSEALPFQDFSMLFHWLFDKWIMKQLFWWFWWLIKYCLGCFNAWNTLELGFKELLS